MKRLIAVLGACNKYVCAAFIAAMVIIVFANTMLRYLFNSGIIMGEELVRFFFVWAAYLGVISVYYEKKHIAVTTLTDRLSPGAAAALAFVMNFVTLFVLAILFQGSVMYFNETTNMGQATGLPYKVMVVPVIIAAVCCFCLVVADMIGQIARFRRGAE